MKGRSLQFQALGRAHIASAYALSSAAGWNQTRADWKMMLASGEGVGCFASSELVGTCVIIPYPPAFAWISMVLVAESSRRQGIATRLVKHCVSQVEAAGMVPMLDATEAGRPVYDALGFVEGYTITRLEGAVAASGGVAQGETTTIQPLMTSDFAEVVPWDAARYTTKRGAMLASLLERAPSFCFKKVNAHGKLTGFCMGRPGRSATQIGPVVALDASDACSLIARARRAAERPVIIDVPDEHATVSTWLQSVGFSPRRRLVRMVKGSREMLPPTAHAFAIAGPELG